MKDKLKKMFDKKKLSEKDKEFILEESQKAGIKFNPKRGCSNCYKDQITVLYNLLTAEEVDAKKWFKPQYAVGINVNGVIYSELNMTKEKANDLIKMKLGKFLLDEI